jgi:hypothetical protein
MLTEQINLRFSNDLKLFESIKVFFFFNEINIDLKSLYQQKENKKLI